MFRGDKVRNTVQLTCKILEGRRARAVQWFTQRRTPRTRYCHQLGAQSRRPRRPQKALNHYAAYSRPNRAIQHTSPPHWAQFHLNILRLKLFQQEECYKTARNVSDEHALLPVPNARVPCLGADNLVDLLTAAGIPIMRRVGRGAAGQEEGGRAGAAGVQGWRRVCEGRGGWGVCSPT